MIRSRISLFVCILTLLTSLSASAGDPAGWWTSSSGNRINIWANMQQVQITIVNGNGQQFKYNGYWTRFSDNFSYTAGNQTYNASFASSNQIRVTGPNGRVTTWNRGNSAPPAPRPQPQAKGVDGLWASTSGSSVQLSSQGQQIFVTIISKDGKRYEGSGRWTNYPWTFDYSIPGIAGVAHCSMRDDGRIMVKYGNNKPTFWSRR